MYELMAFKCVYTCILLSKVYMNFDMFLWQINNPDKYDNLRIVICKLPQLHKQIECICMIRHMLRGLRMTCSSVAIRMQSGELEHLQVMSHTSCLVIMFWEGRMACSSLARPLQSGELHHVYFMLRKNINRKPCDLNL